MSIRPKTCNDADRRLTAYKKVVYGSAMVACPAASAGVVMFEPIGGPVTAPRFGYISWDMTSSSTGSSYDPSFDFSLTDHFDIHGPSILTSGYNARKLAFGESIGASSSYWAPNYAAFFDFPEPSRGFIGLRFQINGNDHFGWAEVEFTDGNQTLHRWGYEDQAGVSILAGAGISAVPEPGSNLALLALGCAGVISNRRRRAAQRS